MTHRTRSNDREASPARRTALAWLAAALALSAALTGCAEAIQNGRCRAPSESEVQHTRRSRLEPTTAEINEALSAVAPAVRRCLPADIRLVTVAGMFSGAGGFTPTNVERPHGAPMPAAVAECVRGAVASARVGVSWRTNVTVEYAYASDGWAQPSSVTSSGGAADTDPGVGEEVALEPTDVPSNSSEVPPDSSAEIRARYPEFRRCFARASRGDEREFVVRLELEFAPTGRLRHAEAAVSGSALAPQQTARVARCIEDAVRGATAPRSASGLRAESYHTVPLR